ncbi:MAG: helix-turn-helix transcriptional regulator [Bacteroidetes bacterium]|nr:helix-turn-helix transcriptional regulator [Bacteroidota bacterium]
MSKSQKQKLKLFGEHVKALRKGKGLTLKELSHSIDKDPQSIHRLEKGQVNPSYLYLLDLCRGLEIDIKDLFDSEENSVI